MTKDFALCKVKSDALIYFCLLCPVVSLEEQHDFVKSKYMALTDLEAHTYSCPALEQQAGSHRSRLPAFLLVG